MIKYIWPVDPHTVTRGFGYDTKPNPYYGGVHAATDMIGSLQLKAVCDGTLQHNPFMDTAGGWTCWIDTADGWRISYYHMKSPSPVPAGSFVQQGDVIGIMGTTGVSLGVHLHLMFWHKTRQGQEALARPNGWWAHDPENYLGKEEQEEIDMFLVKTIDAGKPTLTYVIGPTGKRYIDDTRELSVYERKLGKPMEIYQVEADSIPDAK